MSQQSFSSGDGSKSSVGSNAHPLAQYSAQPASGSGNDTPFYKSSAPTISLPKGGGALKGIDEKFSVNAVNGTAGMEIPLPFTPGRGGFTPALSLSYNSGSGNSAFGLGWGLSLPAIQRRTDKKLPEYNDAHGSDVFILAGAEDLVPKLYENHEQGSIMSYGDYRFIRYIPRIEGLFARIEHIWQPGTPGSWWRVTTKDNTTTYYGLTEEARIADPEDPTRIFSWLPQLVVDHKGNVQRFGYLAEDERNLPTGAAEKNRVTNGQKKFANTYLKRVQYCNTDPIFITDENSFAPSLTLATSFLMEAVLDYGDHSSEHAINPDQAWPSRGDAFSAFQSGFDIRTYRRCKRVMLFHHFSELAGKDLVRTLELTYRNDALAEGTLTEVDYIVAATQKGYDYVNNTWHSKALPAMTFDYQPLTWNTDIQSVTESNFSGAPQGLTGPYQWIDFDGEGISGILTEQANGWFYKSNLGNGEFTPPQSITYKPSFNGLSDGSLQWQDLDADGRRQVVADAPIKGFWELSPVPEPRMGGTGFVEGREWSPFQTFPKNINIDWSSPFTKMLDLNGDGKADLLLTEDRVWTWYENEGKQGFDFGGQSPVFFDEEKGPVLLLRDMVQSIFLADMSGDGMTDLVRIKNGEVCYWPNLGYGKFGAKVTMGYAPVFAQPDQFNPQYLSLADVSGSGAADLIYVGQNHCIAWINLSGNAWSEGIVINPLPATDQYSKIAVLDFLGNGTGCIVWSSPLPQHSRAPLQYIDLMGGKKPHLMRSYNNGMGKTVAVTYKTSTQFYLADKKEGIHWATKLPFPVHCIHTITTSDSVSGTSYTQSYTYRHGYYDHEEREFRGFGYVETLDIERAQISTLAHSSIGTLETLDQPPVLTKTWYHTGACTREGGLLKQYKKEYFPVAGWDDSMPIATFPAGMDAAEFFEAHRALKGLPLRQEVYAQDGDDLAYIPYAVTASAYTVKLVQEKRKNRYASFLTQPQQSMVFSCERDAEDPRIMQELTLQTDTYGNVLQSAQVAYPRKTVDANAPQKVKDEQAKMHITCTQNSFTNDAITVAQYRLRVPYEAQSFEALGLTQPTGLWTVDSFNAALNAATEIDFSATASGAEEKRLLSHTRTLFKDNNAAATPLALGTIETLAIPHEQYQLVSTLATRNYCYGSKIQPGMKEEGGFTDLDNDQNWWLSSGTAQYVAPATHFYNPVSFTDPWGKTTTISYWGSYHLLPQTVTNALGLISSIAAYHWRNLQPVRMKDANNNISEMLYDALGLPVAMAVKGKGTEGDELDIDLYSTTDEAAQTAFFNSPTSNANTLLQGATWRCVYDLHSTPVSVGMIARQKHVHDATPSVTGQNTDHLVRLSYTDGMGRIIMHKAQCEPNAENSNKAWIGSGRTIYNNKGNAVMQFEPYFSDSHLCDTAEQAANLGVSPKLYYDALGRVFKTELPDGTFTKTEWTAWEQLAYDNNDTVKDNQWYTDRINGQLGTEEKDAATKAALHYNTPTVQYTDSMARPFYTRQYLKDKTTATSSDYIDSYAQLDIIGNRIAVIDGRGNTPLQYRYNLLKQPCYQTSIDSGEGFTLTDAAGQPLYAWDADNRRFAMVYDGLRRPTSKTVAFYNAPNWTNAKLLETFTYGEGQTNAAAKNFNGQLYAHCDASGKQSIPDGYDFKGNPKKVQQQLLEDKTATDTDWNTSPVLSALDLFESTTLADALGRPVRSTDPGGNITEHVYDKGGALKSVILNGSSYVSDIHYDAKGQRSAIWYGNGTKTGYTYNANTYRLTRLLTVNVNTASPSYNEVLQDLNYWYDPVGNITQIKDAAQQTIFFNNGAINPDQLFTYDALYRLSVAEGREKIGLASFGAADNTADSAWKTTHKGDSSMVQRYTQRYTYDAVGNITQLKHEAANGSYTRNYAYATSHSQLLGTTVGSDTYTYTHDTRGNMLTMPHLGAMDWNVNNELQHIIWGTTNQAYYQYSGGQRIRKYVDKGTVKEERIYLGGFEIYRKFNGSSLIVKRTTIHVSDDTGRIAMQEARISGNASDDNNTAALLTRYIYSNHLQSASLELDETAQVISYEEYHPYGTTSYQAMSASINATAKRYCYTGKERDEESGLYYHGARYYVPWLCRWAACDPINSEWYNQQKGNSNKNLKRQFVELTASPYEYCYDNPVRFTDPTGEQVPSNLYAGQQLSEVVVKEKISFWDKAGAFLKGAAKGVVIAAAVVSIIAFTGGLGLAGLATAMTYTALTVGVAATIKTGVELVTGKEMLSGRELGSLEKYSMGGELIGGIIGGGRMTSGKANVNVERSPSKNVELQSSGFSTKTETPVFSKPTTTQPSIFSEPTKTSVLEFNKSILNSEKLSGHYEKTIDVEAASQQYSYNKVQDPTYDCSEIAEWIYRDVPDGNILNITPKEGKWLNGIEYGAKEEFMYHRVFMKNGYIYDPMYGDTPIDADIYFDSYNKMNPKGLNIEIYE